MTASKEDIARKKLVLLVYRSPKHHRYAWISVVLSMLCTFALFTLLPFTEMLNLEAGDIIELRDLDTADMKLTPPKLEDKAPPRARPMQEEQKPKSSKPKLQLPEAERKISSLMALSMDMGVSDYSGDFALTFATVSEENPGSARLTNGQAPVVFNIDEVDRKPRVLLRSAPVIPYQARVKNIEGHVKVIFTVTPEGGVVDILVAEAVPDEIFNESAMAAVARWRFEPALKDGKPVAVKVMTRLLFELK